MHYEFIRIEKYSYFFFIKWQTSWEHLFFLFFFPNLLVCNAEVATYQKIAKGTDSHFGSILILNRYLSRDTYL